MTGYAVSCQDYVLTLCDADACTYGDRSIVQMRMNLRMRMIVPNPMPMHVHALCSCVSEVPRQPPGASARLRPTSAAAGPGGGA